MLYQKIMIFPEVVMYKPKMFKEAEKSTASENLFVNIIVFVFILLIILIAESIIPSIMVNPELKQFMRDNPSAGMKELVQVSTELTMRPKIFLVSLLCTGFGTLISIIYCRYSEARHLSSMGVRKEKVATHYGTGLLVGIVLMTSIVLISVVTGINRISLCSDINFGLIALFLGGFLIQGMSEEFIFRGYLMNTIGSRHNTVIAVVISGVAFSLAHLFNPGFNLLVFFNLALFGVFAALYMIYFDDIWGVCGIHSIWNFTQGNFYGISVSGTGDMDSVFRTTAKSSSALLTGGDFGIEGSLITTVVLTAGAVIMFILIRKKSAQTAE